MHKSNAKYYIPAAGMAAAMGTATASPQSADHVGDGGGETLEHRNPQFNINTISNVNAINVKKYYCVHTFGITIRRNSQ